MFAAGKEAKQTVECDIVVFDPNDLSNADQYFDQGVTNGKIIAASKALVGAGNDVTVGVLNYGEAKGGNNAPILLESIDTSTETGQQIFNYIVQYGQYLSWIPAE